MPETAGGVNQKRMRLLVGGVSRGITIASCQVFHQSLVPTCLLIHMGLATLIWPVVEPLSSVEVIATGFSGRENFNGRC